MIEEIKFYLNARRGKTVTIDIKLCIYEISPDFCPLFLLHILICCVNDNNK